MECTLDAFTRGDLAHDEVRIESAVTTGDDDTFVSLSTLAGTFDNVDVDDDGVARRELRNVFAQTGEFFLLSLLDQVHFQLHEPSCRRSFFLALPGRGWG